MNIYLVRFPAGLNFKDGTLPGYDPAQLSKRGLDVHPDVALCEDRPRNGRHNLSSSLKTTVQLLMTDSKAE